MNQRDRKRLGKLVEILSDVHTELEEMAENEQEKYDNLPEGIQESERGEEMLEVAELLQEKVDELSDIIDSLSEYSE